MKSLFILVVVFCLFSTPIVAQEGAAVPAEDPVEILTVEADLNSETGNATAQAARNFQACKVSDPNNRNWGTSAKLLQETARCVYDANNTLTGEGIRLTLIEDIYTKAWSYALINKIAYWLSIVLGVLVLIWPSLVAIVKPNPVKEITTTKGSDVKPSDSQNEVAEQSLIEVSVTRSLSKELGFLHRVFGTASAQTTVTALAALSFALYAHYKDKQSIAENLMRTALYSETLSNDQVIEIVDRMRQMDQGFQFSTSSNGAGKGDQNLAPD